MGNGGQGHHFPFPDCNPPFHPCKAPEAARTGFQLDRIHCSRRSSAWPQRGPSSISRIVPASALAVMGARNVNGGELGVVIVVYRRGCCPERGTPEADSYELVGELSADVVGKPDSVAGNFRMRCSTILPQFLAYPRHRWDAVIRAPVPAVQAGPGVPLHRGDPDHFLAPGAGRSR